MNALTAQNLTWALDFMTETLYDGRLVRLLIVPDEGNREALEMAMGLPLRVDGWSAFSAYWSRCTAARRRSESTTAPDLPARPLSIGVPSIGGSARHPDVFVSLENHVVTCENSNRDAGGRVVMDVFQTVVGSLNRAVRHTGHQPVCSHRLVALIGSLALSLPTFGTASLATSGTVPATYHVVAVAGLMALSACGGGAQTCRSFSGSCTGFGGRQTVVAPVSLTPDAITIEQSCSGTFQYPWIEVCEGREPTRGCGFCVF